MLTMEATIAAAAKDGFDFERMAAALTGLFGEDGWTFDRNKSGTYFVFYSSGGRKLYESSDT